MKWIICFGLFFVSTILCAEEVGDAYTHTDGTKSIIVKMGKDTDGGIIYYLDGALYQEQQKEEKQLEIWKLQHERDVLRRREVEALERIAEGM